MESRYKIQSIPPIVLEGDAKVEHGNEWRICGERKSQLKKQHGQAFYMIRCKCMQVLLDQMKHDSYWYNTRKSYDTLNLLKLIEKTILDQTENKYCYTTVYDQEFAMYGFNQYNLTT